MKGIVEIYSKGKLLVSENITLDKAGENIADFMTLSPDIVDITSASALLDTSNYTIQAISFGKDASAFTQNAHNLATISEVQTLFGPAPYEIATSSYGGSAVTTINGLPTAVSPLDTELEPIVGLSYGQNQNALNYVLELISNGTIANLNSGIALGCYGYRSAGFTSLNLYNSTTSSMDASSASVISNFNAVSSMDYRGFCKTVSGTDTSAGLTVSSVNNTEVAYALTIASGDVASSDFYGGISIMGLWTLDLSATLALGAPPFDFHPVVIGREYKLNNKKVFTHNIVNNEDATLPGINGYSDLDIIWRLSF